jgi:flavin-dependent dehydrogenase
MRNIEHDVVIVGASFAGLATAYSIEDAKILILERQKELGQTQKSTCATSVEWMEKLNCMGSVLKTFDYFTIHSSNGQSARIRLPHTFCSIDYKKFCTILASSLENTEIFTGNRVIGMDWNDSNTLLTKDGRYSGKILVDASGWPGIRGNNRKKVSRTKRKRPAFGLEIETEFHGNTDSFHIYYGKKFVKNGYAWIYPTGKDQARIGLGAYTLYKPHEALDRFLSEINVKRDGLKPHGGYLPLFGLGEPMKGNTFVVGDACNQVLPLSGEGIRKTFEYAEFCGRIITKILRNELTLEDGLKEYSTRVFEAERFYDNLRFAQAIATSCPDWGRNRIIRFLSRTDSAELERLLVRYFDDEITSSKTGMLKTVFRGILA